MVTEWEKEELGRLTLRNLKSVPNAEGGRMTHQNLQSLKGAQKKTEARDVRVKLFLERLRGMISSTVGALFSSAQTRKGTDACELYGHNWVFGTSWEGLYPKCLDCKKPITDASQLRGALTKEERRKFKAGRL